MGKAGCAARSEWGTLMGPSPSSPPGFSLGGLAPRIMPDLALLGILIAWHVIALGYPSFVLPGPIDVFSRWLAFLTQPDLLSQVGVSFSRVAVSLAIAYMLGFLLAWCAYEVPMLGAFIDHRLGLLLNAFPSVGWAVVVSIWMSASDAAVIVIQILILVPFVLINCRAGFVELDREIVEMGRSLTRNRLALLVRIYIPLMRHYLFTAFQFALGLSFKIAVVAELFGAEQGIGVVMLRAQSVSDTTTILAGCFVFLLLYAASAGLLKLVERAFRRNLAQAPEKVSHGRQD